MFRGRSAVHNWDSHYLLQAIIRSPTIPSKEVITLNLSIQDTNQQYDQLFSLDETQRPAFFRYTMMTPFEKMWNTINVPLQAKQPGGYDVIMASKMLGYLDMNATETGLSTLQLLKEINALRAAEDTLDKCIDHIENNGLRINAEELIFGMYIADPQKLEPQKGYTGFGGIPGFIQVIIHPNAYNIPKIPPSLLTNFIIVSDSPISIGIMATLRWVTISLLMDWPRTPNNCLARSC
ncbi:hypothetical protein D3C87_998530 [compost metagenome]